MQQNSGLDSQPSQEQNQRQQQPPRSQPQWVAMQYPAAAMVMQHQMMQPQHFVAPPLPPQHYMPYHHLHLNGHAQQGSGGGSGENKTVWVGDLYHWMDENYLHSCFASTGEIASIKVIRNKQTGLPEGYGFVEFFSHATAEKVLQSYSSVLMPNTDQPFRLNWATLSTGEKRSENGPDLSIFVGDLGADVTDSLLHETFASKYPSVKTAKVVIDANTGRSKGYGFVRFGDETERSQAMNEMNGVYCSSRPMRIGAATPRKSSGYQQQYSLQDTFSFFCSWKVGMHQMVTQLNLMEILQTQPNNAEEALQKLNGMVIGKQTVRLSWGRNPANKQFRGDYGNQWGGAYYGGQVYDGYGYAVPPPHDPGMYAAAYGAYPIYGSHQQQVS
ncbi:Polyadenylate-binding RBP47C -like protein [Gossypium arboreum]|uniref:Polyadenylate-binding RBP47C-like protein n=1 Tax=Gossypium arboreum TaxID=29729 RepID=A0A0B0MSD9_GOSAR|nr:Polyadenylate-binding RBP47C -like protein [Gossypium arboreum]